VERVRRRTKRRGFFEGVEGVDIGGALRREAQGATGEGSRGFTDERKTNFPLSPLLLSSLVQFCLRDDEATPSLEFRLSRSGGDSTERFDDELEASRSAVFFSSSALSCPFLDPILPFSATHNRRTRGKTVQREHYKKGG
jgi:hypothetical protein